MAGKEKESPGRLEVILATALGLGAFGFFGPILGLEANTQLWHKVKIQDVSFRGYLEQAKKEYGDNSGTYALALWTYPGARLGATIHNYRIAENSDE